MKSLIFFLYYKGIKSDFLFYENSNMKILVLNAGSSSLKYQLFDVDNNFSVEAKWLAERIGIEWSIITHKDKEWNKSEFPRDLANHWEALKKILDILVSPENGAIKSLDEIGVVGHRMVHGWEKFHKSALVNDEIMQTLKDLIPLAPLHNPANITGIEAVQQVLPNIPNVVVFDTAFHQSMDPEHFLYPVPYEWYEKYGVRRYGFHGTSHKYVYQEICKYLNNDKLKVITCHIGNGGSITAIDAWKVIETSMGFTPLPGIMMGSRSWDIDPSILEYICSKKWVTISEATKELNKNSWLLGISGISSDSRDIEDAIKEGNERAKLTQNMYVQKIANYVAMYNNMLNWADAIVMTAGVWENSINTRKMICEKIASLGIKIDENKNNFRWEFREISADDSKIPVYVIPTNEELMIAEETYESVK